MAVLSWANVARAAGGHALRAPAPEIGWHEVERHVHELMAASGRPVQQQLGGVADGSERLRRRLTTGEP